MRNKGVPWVHENYLAPQDGPCVEWPFALNSGGYGLVRVDGRKRTAHSYALTLRDGPAPPGMVAAHGPCHNNRCIIHVSWKTGRENALDKHRDGTMCAKLTHNQVREIRRLRATGEPRWAVAAQFGVSGTMITYITRGDYWST